VDTDRARLKEELAEQIKERLRYYASITPIGLRPGSVTETPERSPSSDSTETLEAIQEDLGDCTRCNLHKGRQTIVFGVGNPNADLMFVGEGPGYEEDAKGLPFVGPAGQLLTKIIEAIQLTREQVYIANVVKCRPPSNRDPEPEEIATCRPFLERQVGSIRPRVICTLGRVATQAMLSTEEPLGRLRGQVFTFGDAVLVPTYHPAFLLRDPSKKRDTWEDMKLIRALLDERR
jgi:DNA polymerase